MKWKTSIGTLSFRRGDAVDSVWFCLKRCRNFHNPTPDISIPSLSKILTEYFVMVYSLRLSVLQFALCCSGLTVPFWCVQITYSHKKTSTYIIISQETYFAPHATGFFPGDRFSHNPAG